MKKQSSSFIALLSQVSRIEGLRTGETMRLFIDMAFLAIRGRVLRQGQAMDTYAKNEMQWHARMAGLRDRHAVRQLFAEALAQMTIALQSEMKDFLGPIFMETNADPSFGQFFTPDSLCDLMACLTSLERWEPGERKTIQEPAAGMGAMMLAMARRRLMAGGDPARDIHFSAIEINGTTARACFVQMDLAGLSADVFWGDSLRLKMFDDGWSTRAALAARLERRAA